MGCIGHVYNPSTEEAETGSSFQDWSQAGLHSVVQVITGHRVIPYHKETNKSSKHEYPVVMFTDSLSAQ